MDYATLNKLPAHHAGSAWMLKGFLDGPASIVVYRDNQKFKIK